MRSARGGGRASRGRSAPPVSFDSRYPRVKRHTSADPSARTARSSFCIAWMHTGNRAAERADTARAPATPVSPRCRPDRATHPEPRPRWTMQTPRQPRTVERCASPAPAPVPMSRPGSRNVRKSSRTRHSCDCARALHSDVVSDRRASISAATRARQAGTAKGTRWHGSPPGPTSTEGTHHEHDARSHGLHSRVRAWMLAREVLAPASDGPFRPEWPEGSPGNEIAASHRLHDRAADSGGQNAREKLPRRVRSVRSARKHSMSGGTPAGHIQVPAPECESPAKCAFSQHGGQHGNPRLPARPRYPEGAA